MHLAAFWKKFFKSSVGHLICMGSFTNLSISTVYKSFYGKNLRTLEQVFSTRSFWLEVVEIKNVFQQWKKNRFRMGFSEYNRQLKVQKIIKTSRKHYCGVTEKSVNQSQPQKVINWQMFGCSLKKFVDLINKCLFSINLYSKVSNTWIFSIEFRCKKCLPCCEAPISNTCVFSCCQS